MRRNSNLVLILVTIFVGSQVLAPGEVLSEVRYSLRHVEIDEAESWLAAAEEACLDIEDSNAADLALSRLLEIRIQWGRIEKAELIAAKIKDPNRRGRAWIAIACFYAKNGDLERARIELDQVAQTAAELRNELVSAYLEDAQAPQRAISFIRREHNDRRGREQLCESLARHGYLNEAMDFASSEMDARQQSSLRLKVATGAARGARIEDTEEAVRLLVSKQSLRQFVWGELAAALYDAGEMEAARRYAARVTSAGTRRRNVTLLRIESDVPPDTPEIETYNNSPSAGRLPTKIPLPSLDPMAADRLLESVIADAEENPIESSKGQFGPWNQELHLARIRTQYAILAALNRKAGNDEQAERHLDTALEALRSLAESGSIVAQISMMEMQHTLLSNGDIVGLMRLHELTQEPFLRHGDNPVLPYVADAIVPEWISSGKVEQAKSLAKSALLDQRVFNRWPTGQCELIGCFIEAEDLAAALEVMKASQPGSCTARACEHAGRVLVETGHKDLLDTPEWRDDIGAFQQVHLYIGVAILAKETSEAD